MGTTPVPEAGVPSLLPLILGGCPEDLSSCYASLTVSLSRLFVWYADGLPANFQYLS